jgi:Domain of unknown function (DUF4386)
MSTTNTNTRALSIATGAVLIFTGLMSLAPFPILGPAIGWPGSLDSLAATQLTAIGKSAAAVATGYSVYLTYSLLFLPALAMAAHTLLGGFSRTVAQLVIAFAALSVLARSIGILRWLTVMPELSRSHAAADASGKAGIEQVFLALNSYGGGIGELLGVSLFAAVAVLLLAVGAWRAAALPHWLTVLGVFAALSLFALFLPAMGLAIDVPIALAVTSLSVWMWALGGWLLVRRPAAAGRPLDL